MITVLYKIKRLIFFLNLAMITIAGWIVILIVALTSYSVFMRYIVGNPETWSFPLSSYLLSFIVFLGLSYTLQEKAHVKIAFMVDGIKGPLNLLINFISDLLSIFFICIFLFNIWDVFNQSLSSWRIDETTLALPIPLVQWVLPLGVLLLLVTQVLLMVSRIIEGIVHTK